jgi:hypothetical protein
MTTRPTIAISLRCPHCGSRRSRVLGHANRSADDTFLRRSRKCIACKRNYMTREYVEQDSPLDAADIKVALSLLAKAAQTITKGRKSRRR